jgi:hypothetical protein
VDRAEFAHRLRQAVDARKAGARCACGAFIWAIGSAEAGAACFTCITGEAWPDSDYEIDEAWAFRPAERSTGPRWRPGAQSCTVIENAGSVRRVARTFDPTKTWFNIDAGFERDTADQPAAFQKRAFPFRVDGVRGFDLSYLNASVARTFRLGGSRTFQFRLDIQNLLNRQHYANPDMNRPARPSDRSGR